MILLVGGGLYGRSLWKAYTMDLGFDSEHLLTAVFSLPPPSANSADRMWTAQEHLLQQLATAPGVISATLSSAGILNAGPMHVQIERPSAADSPLQAVCEFAGPDFFRTMGISLLEGRDFAARDQDDGTIAIVNRALADRLFAGLHSVGETISVDTPARKGARFVIAGVAADARYASLWEKPAPRIYLPATRTDVAAGFLTVRTSAPPMELADPVRRLWERLVPPAPLYEIQTAKERVDFFLTPQRVAAAILGGFAMLALILTAIGLYSVVACAVERQRRELGIRIAIGARPSAIFSTVLRRSMTPVMIGLAGGVAASGPLMRVLATRATNVSAHDGPTYVGVAIVLGAVACLAAIVPARRAMRVDPAAALRSE
jgi:predicted permease